MNLDVCLAAIKKPSGSLGPMYMYIERSGISLHPFVPPVDDYLYTRLFEILIGFNCRARERLDRRFVQCRLGARAGNEKVCSGETDCLGVRVDVRRDILKEILDK